MQVIEFIHDHDHPDIPSNVDLWVQNHPDIHNHRILVKQAGELPEYDSFDLLILHGGTQHLWDKDSDPWLNREIHYVRKALENNLPVIGLCLGSQIIAEALGARVYRASTKEVGFYRVKSRPQAQGHLLLNTIQGGFNTFLYHSDHYELPQGCISLAYTRTSANQIFASNRFPAIGFQFHPEYTKSMIQSYCEASYQDPWMIEGFFPDKQGFLKKLETMPETYGLFDQLMSNGGQWLEKQFNINILSKH